MSHSSHFEVPLPGLMLECDGSRCSYGKASSGKCIFEHLKQSQVLSLQERTWMCLPVLGVYYTVALGTSLKIKIKIKRVDST